MINKKIVFLTGTRADFGKLKSLIKITQESELFEVHIFATGMHMNSKYGSTVEEIYKSGFKNIYKFINHDTVEHMDRTLAKTIDGFSSYIAELSPDLIVVHGDRVEAMSGAIVGSLNNILVAHIEGGEVSGTIDELIRHAVSKMSHIHLVANEEAKERLLQLGESSSSIYTIGSPDLDLMNPSSLPSINIAKQYYDVNFKSYAIAMYHPVTTEYDDIRRQVKSFVDAMIESNLNYIVIYPNNDLGSNEILEEYKRLDGLKKFKVYPSVRFEYFLTFLKNASLIVGNSSAGIREAPFYNVPTVDIGTRQLNRAKFKSVFHSSYEKHEIIYNINKAIEYNPVRELSDNNYFGSGKSDVSFLRLISESEFWLTKKQKQFIDIKR